MPTLDFSEINDATDLINWQDITLPNKIILTVKDVSEDSVNYYDISKKNSILNLEEGEHTLEFIINTVESTEQSTISKKILLKNDLNYGVFIGNDWKEILREKNNISREREQFKKNYKFIVTIAIITLLTISVLNAIVLILPLYILYTYFNHLSKKRILNQVPSSNPDLFVVRIKEKYE